MKKESVEEGKKASQNLERKEGETRIKMKGENIEEKNLKQREEAKRRKMRERRNGETGKQGIKEMDEWL